MKQKKQKEDILSNIRNGQMVSTRQQLRIVIALSVPAILTQIASIIMQYIDASMVGRLGADDSASIGLVSSTTWLFGSLCFAAAMGFSVQVAQHIGARKNEEARGVLRQSLTAVFLFSLMLTIIGIALSRSLPKLLGGADQIRENATLYFLIYSCSLPIMGLNCLAASMLQCSGNMKIPSILNILMCLMNVVFNALFIFPQYHISVLGFTITIWGVGLGVKGAALGTALAELLTTCFMLYFLCFRTSPFYLKKNESFKPTAECLKKAIRIAFPIGFENFVVCGAMIVSTSIVAPLGIVSIAAHSFAITAESMCYMPGYGIENAATVLVGQSVGAGRKDLSRRFARITVALGMIVMTFTGTVMFFVAPIMISFFTPNLEVQKLGTQILRIEAFAEPMYAAAIVTMGALRGAGDTLIPSIMNFVSMWAVRIPLSYLLAMRIGLKGVWIAMCIELCFRGTILLIRLFREKWLGNIILKQVEIERDI